MFGRVRMGAGITGLALVLMGSSPAAAKNEFENGFKDELGRVAAHEAVGAGRQILAGVLFGGGPRVAAPAPYREPAYRYDDSGDYGYDPEPYGRTVVHRHDHYYHPARYERPRGHGWGHHRRHHKHHHRGHYRGHDCD